MSPALAPHLLREARAQAHVAVKAIFRRIHKRTLPEDAPPLGRLQALAEREWTEDRHGRAGRIGALVRWGQQHRGLGRVMADAFQIAPLRACRLNEG